MSNWELPSFVWKKHDYLARTGIDNCQRGPVVHSWFSMCILDSQGYVDLSNIEI